MNICIYGAASDKIDKVFRDYGELLGNSIAKNGHTLIFGGGASGMMGAVARGCYRENGKIIGITPSFFNVDGVLFEHCTELLYTETMGERKKLLEDKCDAFLVTPGGIGTFDEFFETLTLRKLKIHSKPIGIYNINGYFNSMIALIEDAINKNFVSAYTRGLYCVSDNPDVILEYFNKYDPTELNKIQYEEIK